MGSHYKKRGFHITTRKKTHKWNCLIFIVSAEMLVSGLDIFERKELPIVNFENVLRPIFGDNQFVDEKLKRESIYTTREEQMAKMHLLMFTKGIKSKTFKVHNLAKLVD